VLMTTYQQAFNASARLIQTCATSLSTNRSSAAT
jgi:flagellar hook-associated protein FlgK